MQVRCNFKRSLFRAFVSGYRPASTAVRCGRFAPGGFGPYPISYRALLPKRQECENLLVTFALSASHVAFASIRMEPVFMVTSQSAATAACLALHEQIPVQQVDYTKLKPRLLKDGQVLEWNEHVD
jgi:hypothetical protein